MKEGRKEKSSNSRIEKREKIWGGQRGIEALGQSIKLYGMTVTQPQRAEDATAASFSANQTYRNSTSSFPL
jgi:hypothetical protein